MKIIRHETYGPEHEGWVQQLSPAEVGLNAVDLKTVAATNSNFLNLAGFRRVMVVFEYVIAGTTPLVGTVDVDLELYADDETTKVVDAVELMTLTSTEAAGTYRSALAWGEGTTAIKGTATTTAANMNVLKVMTKTRIIVDVTTAYDQAGAKTGSVYVFAMR